MSNAPSFLAWIPPAVAGTTANISGTFTNHGGPGSTISDAAGVSPLVVDTHTVALGDRVLVMNQTLSYQNGVYLATTANSVYGQVQTFGTITQPSGTLINGTYHNVALAGGSGSGVVATIVVAGGVITSVVVEYAYGNAPGLGGPIAGSGYVVSNSLGFTGTGLGTGGSVLVSALAPAWVLERAADANTWEQFAGMAVFVSGGSANAGKAFVQTNVPCTVDITSVVSGSVLVGTPSPTSNFPIINGTYTEIPLAGGNGTGAGVTIVVNNNSQINLKSAAAYAVLGSSTVTSTGATVVTGNLGLSPGTSVTGFPPGIVSGTQNVTNSAAAQAITDAQAAYTAGQALAGATVLSVTTWELGGTSLVPGIYKIGTGATITGTVTLNGAGTYIFQIGSTLTAEAASVVLLTGGANAANIFWLVGTSATLDAGATFNGTIIADASISLASTASVVGGLLAPFTGAVTLIDNAVTAAPPFSVVVTSTGSGYLNGDVLEFGNYMGTGVYPGGYYGLGVGGTVMFSTSVPASSAVTFVPLIA